MVRFGRWTFDQDTRRITDVSGAEVHVTPKAFDLLAVLVEQAPRVVRKSDLHARLWPDSFVSEAALAGLVKELRRALQDGDAPLIRTSHGIGFAFCATIEAPIPTGTDRWVIARGRTFLLKRGDNVIGRDPSSHIWLDAAGVSRRHARIVVTAGFSRLDDLGSKNGTWLRGARLTDSAVLADGDSIGVGSMELVYRATDGSPSTETLPPAGRQPREQGPGGDL